jgi:hypothetical protein
MSKKIWRFQVQKSAIQRDIALQKNPVKADSCECPEIFQASFKSRTHCFRDILR